MQKRLIFSLALLLLVPGLIFSSGGKEAGNAEKAAEKVSLKYWTLFGGSDGEIMDLMVKKFNSENPNIYVDFSITVWENYYNQLTAAIAGGDPPDIAIVHTRNLPAFASEKLLYTLDEYLAKAGLSERDFHQLAWKGGSIQGKRYALPLDIIVAMVLFYNKDMYAAAGISGSPKDGAEFIAHAKKIREATGDWGAFVPLTGFLLYRYWYSALYQNGGAMLTDDYKQAVLNSSKGVEALQYWVDAVYKHKVSPERPLGEGEGFRFGKVGMQLDGIWNVNGFRQQENLNWDLFPMPALFRPGDRSFFSNSHNFILPRPKNEDKARVEAAVKFIIWMSENSIIWSDKAGMVSARKSVIDSPEFKKLPYMTDLIKQIDYAKYPPPIKETLQLQDAIIKALEFAMAQKKTAKQALDDAAAEINAMLK
jgi:multiple sugar transport system substrate-binding protein